LKDEHDLEAEVIDLRSLVPLDIDTVVKSVRKTAKALVVHEDKVFGGFGGEIAAQITEKCFDCLDGPVLRVGSDYAPVPFSKVLEREVLPQMDDVVKRALELVRY
jgi:2-oxoisovalerate dehydrogenase E1 component